MNPFDRRDFDRRVALKDLMELPDPKCLPRRRNVITERPRRSQAEAAMCRIVLRWQATRRLDRDRPSSLSVVRTLPFLREA